jgi:hypothetical protein
MTAYVPLPHDPANGLTYKTPGNPCNRGCEGDWPCAERKAQRVESRRVATYLRSDLYKPVPSDVAQSQEGNTWESPARLAGLAVLRRAEPRRMPASSG